MRRGCPARCVPLALARWCPRGSPGGGEGRIRAAFVLARRAAVPGLQSYRTASVHRPAFCGSPRSERGRRNGGWETLAPYTPRRRRWGCPLITASRCTTQAAVSVGKTRIFDVLASEACSSRARVAEFGPTRNQIRFWGLCRAKNAGLLQVSNDRICQRYASLHSYETSPHAVEQPCGATTPEPGTWLSLRQQ